MTPTLAAIAAAMFVTLCYGLWCAVSPFGRCLRCAGKPGKACPGCDSTGRRPRIGRRLYHWARAEYRHSGNGETDYDRFRN
ncbi:hypothetical protein [Glycomyces tarimensis]